MCLNKRKSNYFLFENSGVLSCNEKNIPFFSYMVLEQGALTGRFNSKQRNSG